MDDRDRSPSPWEALVRRPLPLVGMVHLRSLPGSPGWQGEKDGMQGVAERALADAEALDEAGLDALLVENLGDAPYHPGPVPPETVAGMAVVLARIAHSTSLPVGVNVLRNDARAALGLAAAVGAAFIRVNVHTGIMHTDQGTLEGRAHETVRARAHLCPGAGILADVLVKHAVAPAGTSLEDTARDTYHRGRADVLLVSGAATGTAPEPGRLRRVRDAVPGAPVWVASGLTPETASTLLAEADGAIVGSGLKHDGRAGSGVDPARARRLVEAVDPLRRGRS